MMETKEDLTKKKDVVDDSSLSILLAIDIGSSSVRCSAYMVKGKSNDDDNVVVEAMNGCFSSRTYSSVTSSGKIKNISKLLEETNHCMDETLSSLRKQNNTCLLNIIGVAISSFVMNLIGVDRDGNPVGEWASLSYACNSTSVAQECKRLRSAIGSDKIKQMYQSTGTPTVHSAYALPQLCSIYHEYPKDKIDQIHSWQTIASLCIAQWIGSSSDCLPISYSEASWTGMFNFTTCTWEQDVLDYLPQKFRQSLPKLADCSHDTTFTISEYMTNKSTGIRSINPYWERWPELRTINKKSAKRCQFFLGIGDGACANIGSKCAFPSRLAVTIGTSAAARVCIPFPKQNEKASTFHVPYGLFCYRVNKNTILLGGALTDGGSVIEWLRNLLNLKEESDLSDCMEQSTQLYETIIHQPKTTTNDSKNENQNMIFIPFLSGERSTGYRDNAQGCLLGITRNNSSPASFMKTCMEGVILRLQDIIRLILNAISDQQTNEVSMVVASGNALERNPLWRQMLADCSNIDVIMDANSTEGTSKGAAIIIYNAIIHPKAGFKSTTTVDDLNISDKKIPRAISQKYWKTLSSAQNKCIDSVSTLWY